MGFPVFLAGIVLWYYKLLQLASPNDRGFLLALIPALALYALIDNLFLYSSALALFTYFGVVLTSPSPFLAPRALVPARAT
jgi:hypothetical protein